MSPTERRLLQGFAISLLINAAPSNTLIYFASPFLLLWTFMIGDVLSARRILIFSGCLVFFSATAMTFDHVAQRDVNPAGLVFSLFMYAPLLLLLGLDPRFSVSEAFARRFAILVAAFALLQTPIGVAQFVLAEALGLFPGDFVSGTYGLFDIRSGATINQVAFTFTLVSISVFLLAYREMRLAKIAIAASALVIVLAQSAHQLLFFILAFGLASLIRRARLGTVLRAAAIALIGMGALSVAYPETENTAREWARKLFDPSGSPKLRVIARVVNDMWGPRFLVIGTGAGQFTSRAALFSSGDYLSARLPDALTGRSDWFREHLAPELGWYEIVGENSAIAKPYFSLLTVVTEGGLALTVALAALLARFAARQAALTRAHQRERGMLAFFMLFMVIFWFFCCSIENYLELAKGIFPAILLMIVALARERDLSTAAGESLGSPP